MKRITSIGLTVLALQIGQAEITAAQTAAPSAAVENLMQQAQQAIDAEQYIHAVQLLTRLTSMPEHAYSARAQELLGNVREANGQLAHAKAEYETYLQKYPNGEGAARCMRMALRSAGLNVEDISYINAHGTSTPQGDVCETEAIKAVFGDHARRVAVSSTKGATGHMLGAAGAVEMALCCKALETGVVPPTINYEKPDPACDLDYVPNAAREMPVRAILNNSFGFGGHNACLAARRFEG